MAFISQLVRRWGKLAAKIRHPEDLIGFMEVYTSALPSGVSGLDKISIQTGTRHGGIVHADGSLAEMPLDLKLAKELSELARNTVRDCRVGSAWGFYPEHAAVISACRERYY